MKISTLENDGWELENALQLHNNCPEKFKLPPEDEIRNLKVGELVKLRFLFWENDDPDTRRITGEGMWVTITSIVDNEICGVLDNTPVRSKALKANDVIEFNRENVCSIYIKINDARHPLYRGPIHNKLLHRIKKCFAFFIR